MLLTQVENLDNKEYQRFWNTHAEELVPAIKKKAQEKGHKMIELYTQHKDKMMISEAPNIEDPSLLRFASLDLDDV